MLSKLNKKPFLFLLDALALGFVIHLALWNRVWGTSFYLSDIHIGEEPLDFVGGSPVLTQHVFWYLGRLDSIFLILCLVALLMIFYILLQRAN